MDEVSARRYDTTETINIGTLKDDFGVKDIKEIEQSELQSFLTGEPMSVDDGDIDEIKKVDPKKQQQQTDNANDDTDTDDIPTVRKDKKKVTEDDVDDYLSEEEAPKKEKEKGKPKYKPVSDEEEESIFTTLNRDLVKSGIFTGEEEDIKDAEGFKNRFVKEMHKGANNILEQFLSQHGPEYREAFESIFVDGVSPENYFKHIERIDNLEGLDLKAVDNQRSLLRSFYKEKGYSEDKIKKKLESLENIGELEDEATTVHEIMLKEEGERLEEERERSQVEAARREQNKRNYRASIQRILDEKAKSKSFDGIPLDPNTVAKVYSNLTKEVWQLPDGRLITEFDKSILELDKPENFEKKLKLALLLNNDLDLSKIQNEAVKKVSNETFAGLQKLRAKKEIPSSDAFKSFF